MPGRPLPPTGSWSPMRARFPLRTPPGGAHTQRPCRAGAVILVASASSQSLTASGESESRGPSRSVVDPRIIMMMAPHAQAAGLGAPAGRPIPWPEGGGRRDPTPGSCWNWRSWFVLAMLAGGSSESVLGPLLVACQCE